MGGSSYSDTVYTSRVASHRAAGTSYFTHTASVDAGTVKAGTHELLNPAGKNKAGQVVRESRDTDTHPTSRAIAVLFDVTGSMGQVPKAFVEQLGKLMAMLVKKGYVEHPHVLFGGIGDATCDVASLQIGQFESGNEMDEALSKIYLEGGGGGQHTESYELAMYFMARHTEMDCLNKRGQKGYLFLSGDELPYDAVKPHEVKRIIGDNLQAAIPLATMLDELREKFEVFWICPKQGSYFKDATVMDPLREMFGQNMLVLDNANDICALIAATIGVTEGYDIHEVADALVDMGTDAVSAKRATKALAVYADSTHIVKAASANGALVGTGKDDIERL